MAATTRLEVFVKPVSGATSVLVCPLRMRSARGGWIVGRVETGTFVAVPPVAVRAIELLSEGRTVDAVRAMLLAEGQDVDVATFVTTLLGLGFLSQVDGRAIVLPPPLRPTLPWLRARHVRWLLHPAAAWATAGIVVAGIVAVLADRSLFPGYRDLIWSDSGGAVMLGNTAIAWAIIAMHELAHLATARAADVPGRMSLSTRLHFLAAQTDVTGVWTEPRRTRLTVYLAGAAVNLSIAAIAILTLAVAQPTGLTERLLAATVLLSLIPIPFECLVFMRTDAYFVLQDLTGCTNLYADGTAYFRYTTARLWRRLRRVHHSPAADPSRRLPAHERRAVRAYALVLVIGTAICLTVAASTVLPAALLLLVRAVETLVADTSTGADLFDAVAVIAVLGGFHLLWARTWWQRHGHRVRRTRNVTTTPTEEGPLKERG
ncbi:hypothetical protein GCM10009558_006510 [Virgisporangium aurantiacum]